MDSYNVEIIRTNGGVYMKNKIISWVKQNGFLLFLFICVCGVAIGTIWISTGDLRLVEKEKDKEDDLVILEEIKNEENTLENIEVSSLEDITQNKETVEEEIQKEEAEVTVIESDIEKEETKDLAVIEDNAKEAKNKVDINIVNDYKDKDIKVVQEKPVKSILPVEGIIITEYSHDKLIYSTTLKEWRQHPGIDIKAEVGTKVKAPLGGTIKEVREDDLWGITIVIDHGDGLVSKLSNLGTLEMVKPGTTVNKGDFISTIGKSADIEMLMEPHLHFEVMKNGKMIDPRSIN